MRDLDLWRPFKRNFFRDFFDDFPLSLSESKFGSLVREPLIDVVDEGKQVKVMAEIPGVEKKDISIDVTEDSIAISAEQKKEREEKSKGYYYHERGFQKFFRKIALPSEVIPNKSKAEFRDGILTVVLDKKHPAEKEAKSFKVGIK